MKIITVLSYKLHDDDTTNNNINEFDFSHLAIQ